MVLLVQKQLFRHIDEHILSYLSKWESFSRQLSQNPSPEKIAILVTELFQRQGITTRSLTMDHTYIYGKIHTGAPRTLLLYHYYHSPMGNIQDFASIMTCLAAIDAYQAQIGPLPVNIVWLLDGSDTLSNSALRNPILEQKEQLQADSCLFYGKYNIGLVDTDTPLLSLGTKGLLGVELEVQTASTKIHSMHGAVVPNAVWRLLWAVSSLKSTQEEILIDGFYDTLTPIADEMVELLYKLPDQTQSQIQQYGIDRFLLGLQGFQLHYAQLLTPTCTINSISSGAADPFVYSPHTSIPGQAKAQLDFHLVPDQDPDDIFDKLQCHLQAQGFDDVKIRKLYTSRPAYTAITDPFVQMVIRATKIAYGRDPYILPTTANSYPIDPLQQLNLPIVIAQSECITPNDQSDERFIKSFAASIKQVAMVIEEMAYGNASA